jgi:membrane-associated phospholipid phosphatase
MQRASFFVTTILLFGCCLGFLLFMSPRVSAGAVPAGHELGDGVVFAEFHEVDTGLPLSTGNAMCAAEPEAEDMESLHLQVGYVRDKRVGIVTDLHNIYTSPIQVRGSDLCLLMIGTGTMLLVDQDVYDRINAGPRSPEARRLSAVATELGNSLSALAICGLISVKDRDTAYLGANAVAYSGIACLTLKAAFGRARPWQREGPYAFAGPSINEDYNSMPSGHSATAFALATVLAKQYPEYKYVFYACASLIAVSRVYVHAHWPSDVLVGAALGVWSANQVMGRSRILEICW